MTAKRKATKKFQKAEEEPIVSSQEQVEEVAEQSAPPARQVMDVV